MVEEFNIQGKQTSFYKYCPGTFGYTLVYTTLAFLALLGAPYIYEISSLRVNTQLLKAATLNHKTFYPIPLAL